MILERLYLENYKQFREPTELLPPEGAVGVVGRNGSGKTTIFESILWAFFGSRGGGPRFANDAIPWSGGTVADKTIVDVTLNLGGTSYRVSRTLHRGKTEARVFVGDGTEPHLSGSSEVAEWVQGQLLGMDRTAFEATFFARQKELEFFAGVTGVERQREIARILGIDQVEGAQKLLRADRKELRDGAAALESLLAGTDHESLVEELREAREERTRLGSEARELDEKVAEAETGLRAARAEGEKLEAAYRRHNELSGELAAAEGARERAAERATELEARLAGLDEDEETVGKLLPRTEELPRVAGEIRTLEEARRRHERREGAQKEAKRRRIEAHKATAEATGLLEDLDGEDEPLAGWGGIFSVEDDGERVRRAAEVLKLAAGAYEEAEARLSRLRERRSRFEELAAGEDELAEVKGGWETAKAFMASLQEAIEDLEEGGALEERAEALRRKERRLERQSAQQNGLADADERDAEKLERAARMIETSDEVAECPTCHRGFEDGEYDEIVDTLKRQAAALRRRAARETAEAGEHYAAADHTAGKLEGVSGKLRRWRELREELARAASVAADRREALELAQARAAELEARLGGAPAPTEEAREETGALCLSLRRLRDALPGVRSMAREHAGLVERCEGLLGELRGLAKVSYDAQRHAEAREEKDRLGRVAGRIEELERRLEIRPKVQRALEEARSNIEEFAASAKSLRREISALGFDEAEFDRVKERAVAAEERAAGLRDAREQLGGEWKDADHRIERTRDELKRLKETERLAGEKSAAAARMDEMDVLFTEFFKGLTARVRPALEHEASILVRELTDGRYEKMEFDDNYRVRLLDRFDDSYAIERFSGGEADVASLCARVALSKIIAARGSEALGFVVLDEVFGALDAGRRRNVLLALDRLKKTFGQIFIISHVADVQESALLDELWMVEEDEEGRSTVRRQKFDLGEPVELLGNVRGS